MNPGRRFVFLVNPRAARARERARGAAHALGDAVAVVFAEGVEEARALLRAAEPAAMPVAVGGDGTANLVARALRAEGMAARAMGVIPAGTGNAFAHSLGVGRMPDALAALRAGEPRGLDVMVTDHPALPLALVSFSAGFEARFLAEVARRRARGAPGFASPRLLAGLARSSHGVALRCDGVDVLRAEDRFFVAGAYNLPCYFFGRRMIPEADPSDGEARARIYPDVSAYLRALFGSLDRRPPAGMQGCNFRQARFSVDGPVQADGEGGEGGTFEIHVEPDGLRVLGGGRAPFPAV